MEGVREDVSGPGEARKTRQEVKVPVQRCEIFESASHNGGAEVCGVYSVRLENKVK